MRKLILLIIILLNGLLLFSNCVSSSKYKKMEKKYNDTNQDLTKANKKIEELNQFLKDLELREQEKSKRINEFKNLLSNFKTMIDSGKLNIKMQGGKMVLVLSSDVLFSPGSAKLSHEGEVAIQEVAELLKTIPDKKFQIEGHTDSDPTGSRSYSNWELAADRALNVLHTMEKSGMQGDKISAASFGSMVPFKPNDTIEGKKANRRIEIVIVPDLSLLPGFEELNSLDKVN